MPRLKKSARAEFLEIMSGNLRICCKIFGAEKISAVMRISVKSVYNRIKNPEKFTVAELFTLSEYMNTKPENLIRPLNFTERG